MSNFQFVSWILHMSMLIFFSYMVGEEKFNIYSSAYMKEIVNELQDENFLIWMILMP